MQQLTEIQAKEIEIYAGIYPISWDMGVSQPVSEDQEVDQVENKLDAILGGFEVNQ